MTFSLFENMTCKRPVPCQLSQVAQLIRSDGKIAAFTQSYRHTGNKTFKHECPLFAVAVRFEDGKGKEHIRGLTGLSLVDFDHVLPNMDSSSSAELKRNINGNAPSEFRLNSDVKKLEEMKAMIIADPHTVMCYTTISGNGLRVIFRYEIPPEFSQDSGLGSPSAEPKRNLNGYYESAFHAGNAYYEKLIGCKADGLCKNITRLSGLAHDPDVFFRSPEEAQAFTAEEIAVSAATHARQSKEEKQMERIQSYYDTFIAPQLAKANICFQSGSHNEYVMRVGYRLAERRFSKSVALKWAVGKFSADYPDTGQVITSCFARSRSRGGDGEAGGKGGGAEGKIASVEEIKTFLDGHVKLRFNEITSRVEYLSTEWQPINDRTINSLWSMMSAVSRVNIPDMYRVIESDYVPLFNPFKEYLEALPSPEGKDCIRELAETVRVKGGGEEQERWYRYLKKWLVAMVAGWISDDVVNNVILVLIGEQGSFKTTWFNYLLPPELKQYFYTKTNANRMTKDDLLTLAQYALVCCEELDTMRPSELNQLKASVTMTSIDERAAYAHFHEHRKHIASFCGTGNNIQFLSDPTGNRRWLPFEVDHIVSPRDHPFAYEGIYAQALALFRSGFQFWFSREEIQELNGHNRHFETPRLERELVDLYFRKPTGSELGEFMSAARALQLISCGISQKLSAVNVGRAFVELGFKRVRTTNSRGFIVVGRTAEEISAYQHSLLSGSQTDTAGGLPF